MVNESVEIIRRWRQIDSRPMLPKYTPKRYSVGVDLGQAADYTAIAVLQKTIAPPETAMFSPVGEHPGNRLVEGRAVFDLVYLKRPKLGTPYDVIAKRVCDLICKLEPQGAFGELGQVTLCVDGTGVGRGVVDMLRTEFQRRGATSKSVPRVDFRPVSVTGSNTTLKRPDRTHGYWSVPKRDLIFPAVAAFQQSKIRIAKGITDRSALVHELKNYSRKTNIATGNMVFEPWREAEHDDLLFAVCLALWGWQQRRPNSALRVLGVDDVVRSVGPRGPIF
jgi:Terminase RNaseH-like domain